MVTVARTSSSDELGASSIAGLPLPVRAFWKFMEAIGDGVVGRVTVRSLEAAA